MRSRGIHVFIVIGRHLRNRVVAGLVLLIPAALTYFILRTFVGFLDGLIRPFTHTLAQWFPGSHWVDLVPPVGSVVAVLVILYVVGLITRNFIGRRVVRILESLVSRVPVLRAIYGTAREATSLFSEDAERRFSKVVLVTYPHPGAKSIGFVTGTFRSGEGRAYFMVYVPTTPTPMSGFLLFVGKDQIEDAGLTVDAAIRMVVTGGILAQSGPGAPGPAARPAAQRPAQNF